MQIETERLILRDLKKTDVKDLYENVNDISIAKFIPVIAYPYKKKYAMSFINDSIKESKKKLRTKYELCINLKPEKKLIGMIGISKIDRFNGTCTIGYWIAKKYRGQGIMKETLKRVIAFIFEDLKLRRIDIAALAENEASIKLIKKMGFVYEGTRRKITRDQATKKLHDRLIFGMLKEDWLKNK